NSLCAVRFNSSIDEAYANLTIINLFKRKSIVQYSDECNNLVCYALAMLAHRHRQQPTTNKKERMVLVVEG
ncbi:hypothetical protein, partial [Escherichia coli]